MPSRKIISVLILCIGIVLSIWLLSTEKNSLNPKINPFLVSSDEPKTYTKGDWEKILIKIDNNTTTVLTNQNSDIYPDEGTQTDLISRDFMAQYLLLKQGGTEITTEQALEIAEKTLSSAEYTKTTGVKYTQKDLNINSKTSKEIVQTYITEINNSLVSRSPKNLENEMVILDRAVNSGGEKELAKLDPIITGYKGLISDFLQISVPSDALSVHLDFLNSMSNVLSNIESMRSIFSDPVRSFVGVSQYKKHALDLSLAMKKLNDYSLSKK